MKGKIITKKWITPKQNIIQFAVISTYVSPVLLSHQFQNMFLIFIFANSSGQLDHKTLLTAFTNILTNLHTDLHTELRNKCIL